ncbi:hypothetical protein JCM15908A_05350 [Prevotella dentasini JCM 15908]
MSDSLYHVAKKRIKNKQWKGFSLIRWGNFPKGVGGQAEKTEGAVRLFLSAYYTKVVLAA